MLIQVHHQFRNGTTNMCVQADLNTQTELNKLLEETAKTHPLPENAIWMWCKEGAKDFVMTSKEEMDRLEKEVNEN